MLFAEQVKDPRRQASRAPHEAGIARRTAFRVHTPDSCQPSAKDLVGTEELWAAVTLKRLACWWALLQLYRISGSSQASRHTFTSVIPSCVDKTVRGGQTALRGPEPVMEQQSRK